jgi:CheY-like chemotaxis protein
MDIKMPELNGMDATIELRKHNIHTPIVALTANALEGDREYYLRLGMDDYISKPIDVEELHRVLMYFAAKKKGMSTGNQHFPNKEESATGNNSLTEEEPSSSSDVVDTTMHYSVEMATQALLNAKEKMNFPTSVMKHLFEKFITRAQESMEEIIEAVDSKDMQLVSDRAHSLRGMALSLAFDEIGEICKTLEYGAKENKEIEYATLAKDLEVMVSSLLSQKEDILSELEKDA